MMSKNTENTNRKALSLWLFISAGFVFAMVVVGAITRLTESGLSIVEWNPLMGAIPPLNESEWERLFSLYKSSPEYLKKNFWMDLSDFKTIFFWEWFHRLIGRLIGLVYAIPLAFFWVRGLIPQGYKLKLLGLLFLGGAQGLMGWVMVQSGLVDQPAVSHYRLAAHLFLALLIFALLIWTGLSLKGFKKHPDRGLYLHACLALGLVSFTITWGAFTAGLDAGLIYNESFPKMGGQWVPSELFRYDPFWISFLQAPAGVQFIHRWLAILTTITILSLWGRGLLKRRAFPALHILGLAVFIQFGLGITTLLSGVFLPVAALHQTGAVFLLTLLIINIKKLSPQT